MVTSAEGEFVKELWEVPMEGSHNSYHLIYLAVLVDIVVMGDVLSSVYNFIHRYLRRPTCPFRVVVMYLISRCWMLVIFLICGIASTPVFVFL
jgi:hypothetical protein